ncbi:MAG: EscU/YscU/HrcU family type III secretion system export apparatus switch protein [Candidatus Fimivivens sp.]
MSKSNKKNKAVALKYQEETDVAPVVIASGCGDVAEKIIDIAEGKGIPVFRDDSAASLMCMLEVGRSIPPELYQVVAIIYGQLMKVSKDIKYCSQPSPAINHTGTEQLRQQVENGRRPSSKNNK